MTKTPDVVVAGGGVIGTAIAWRAAAAGLGVVIVDPGRGDAASGVAAGMLAPVSESLFGEEALLALNLLALRRFGGFAAELEDVTGRLVGLRREGTLAVAYDAGDHAELLRLTTYRRQAGLAAAKLDGRQCRGLEPFLASGVHAGVLFEGDWSVDNRRYTAALREAMWASGVRVLRDQVVEVKAGGTGGCRVWLAGDSGTDTLGCGAVVVAAGSWLGGIAGLPEPLREVIRPVKGQLLRLRHPAGMSPVLSHTVRATVSGSDVYLVPRADGEVVVGATQEERGHDLTVTAGAVHDLLRDARQVLPVTSELILAETCAGLRPGTPDNGPVVGPASVGPASVSPASVSPASADPASGSAGHGGLLLAAGHYRNGILMSPVTADAVVAFLTGQRPAPEWEPFSPARFTSRARPA